MMQRILGGLTLLGLAALAAGCFSERTTTGPAGGSCGVSLDPSQFGSTIIAIQSFAFDPAAVHVKTGGKVTWVNCEPSGTPSHTTTADGGAWDSPLLDPGSTYTVTFTTAGPFAYHCTPHPFMTASVVVDP